MKRASVAILLVFMLVGLGGCKTLGISQIGGDDEDRDRDQAALEGASAAMGFQYLALKNSDMSVPELMDALLKTGNDFIAIVYPDLISYPALVEKRLADISNDKFQPQVATIYFLVKATLEALEEEEELVLEEEGVVE